MYTSSWAAPSDVTLSNWYSSRRESSSDGLGVGTECEWGMVVWDLLAKEAS